MQPLLFPIPKKNSWSCQYFQAFLPKILLFKVFSCALEIYCKFHGFLKSSTNHAVKFPSSKFNVTPEEACSDPSFWLELVNGSSWLKRNQEYYDQIQGQMALTEAKWCDFGLYTSRGLNMERILFDKERWSHVLAKLHRTYFRYFLPAAAKKKSMAHGTIINRFHFS